MSRRGHFSTGLLGNTLHKWNRKHHWSKNAIQSNGKVRKQVGVIHVTYFVCCKSPFWNRILCAAFMDAHAALNVLDVPIKRQSSLLQNSILSVGRRLCGLSRVAWLRFKLCLCQKPHIKTFLWCTAVHLKHLPKKWWFHYLGVCHKGIPGSWSSVFFLQSNSGAMFGETFCNRSCILLMCGLEHFWPLSNLVNKQFCCMKAGSLPS